MLKILGVTVWESKAEKEARERAEMEAIKKSMKKATGDILSTFFKEVGNDILKK